MEDFIYTYLGLSKHLQNQVFSTLILFFVLWILYRIVGKFVVTKIDDLKTRHQWKRFSLYIIVAVGILVLTRIWFGAFEGLATYLGLVSAGIAIALKDPLVNLIAWIFILSENLLKWETGFKSIK